MTLVERLHSIRDLHNKLVNQPNAVPDYGIDLKRPKDWNVPQIVEPEPQIEAVAAPEPQPEPLPKPYRVKREFPSAADITAVVLERFPHVSLADLKSHRRTRDITYPRQLWCHLARITTPMSFPEMGRYLGHRDHTSTLYGHYKIADLVQRDAMVSHDVNELGLALARRFALRNEAAQ